ncbi:hypothetical protein SADUNF_Sadunf18G0053600 [Salix dunnii]|uniref:Uncharacterized protein n=1 Tax=Salix dunnii TaxID=1413687 RepID=A0A835J439_9ROSI|nr:hypothetical protein SADUNF_Sadunf18G0053600 [Salix dunnii]
MTRKFMINQRQGFGGRVILKSNNNKWILNATTDTSILDNVVTTAIVEILITCYQIVGLMIGTIPPFRNVLIGDGAPLHAIKDFTDMAGKVAIPIMTLILGANLMKVLKGSKVPLLVIVGVVVIRYIVLLFLGVFALPPAINGGVYRSYYAKDGFMDSPARLESPWYVIEKYVEELAPAWTLELSSMFHSPENAEQR